MFLLSCTQEVQIWGSSECPGAPKEIGPHGIHMGQRDDGTDQLLVVNHRGREAVEFFELTGKDTQTPGLTWRGCVVAPDKTLWFNDVATLPGNGFAVTHMMPHGDISELLERAEADQEPTGYVLEWSNETGWKKIPKSEGAINNGILASADGSTLYVAHYLGNQVVAIDRMSGANLWTTEVPSPDNLSFNKSGDLLIASHKSTLSEVRACSHADEKFCGINFSILLVNPENGSSKTLIEGGGAPFGAATVAVEAGDQIVMGSFTGNRIAISKSTEASEGLRIIEGFYHPEDLEVLPNKSLLLVSEYGGLNGEHATELSLVDLDRGTRVVLFPNN